MLSVSIVEAKIKCDCGQEAFVYEEFCRKCGKFFANLEQKMKNMMCPKCKAARLFKIKSQPPKIEQLPFCGYCGFEFFK